MTAAAWNAIGAMGVLTLALLGAGAKFIARARSRLEERMVNELRRELHPNGGGSFRDAMEHRFDRVEDRISHLEEDKHQAHADLDRKHRENQAALHELTVRVARLEEASK